MRLPLHFSALALCLLASACAARQTAPDASGSISLTALAERYVKLVLAVGQHDPNYVDAFYGPPEWAEAAKAGKVPLPELLDRAATLQAELDEVKSRVPEEESNRHVYLSRQLAALEARVRMLLGERYSFDEESQVLYDATSPSIDLAQLDETLAALEAALPGEGSLAERLDAFRQQFAIPKDRLDAVFKAAIDEARRRTLQHVKLPENETFTIEYVSGKSWSGYNWYKGDAKSLIQINTDIPIHPWRAIDLAAHEGYPGHHVYNVLLEQHLVKERGWIEFTIYPLFSPQSLIAEGSANYGIDVAFPDAPAFAREVLFPLAGLDPATAERYFEVESLAAKLDYAGNEAARRYLDGQMPRDAAKQWLVRYGLMSPERAEKRLVFIDTYRTYVINYNVGRDLVREYIERHGGTAEAPERRWTLFRELLASPRLPSALR